MSTKNNINVNLFNGNDTNVPFVKIEYLDKDANEHCALMMIDSCSEVSMLFENMTENLCLKRVKIGSKHVLNGLGNEPQEVKDVELNFTLQSMVCREVFCVCSVDYPQHFEYPVIGLLGNDFHTKHKLALDYSDNTLHTSNVNPSNLSSGDCEYFYPMNLDNKHYRLPVISIKLNGKEIIAGVDSGATNNMLTIQSLAESQVPIFYLGDGDTMVGSNGAVETKTVIVPFCLVSALDEGDKEMKDVAIFNIIPKYIIPSQTIETGDEGQRIPPVEALLGSSFIASQGWVLDFGAQVIYKRKVNTIEKGEEKIA